RIILSRPALVYRADPTHSHGFTIVEVPKGDYPAGVDAVGETLWVTLKNVKGMESDIIGMRKDRWKRMECAKLVGFDDSGESSPVESVAGSPPSAAGRPEGQGAPPGPATDGLSMELMRLSLDNIRAKARQAEAEAFEALDSLDEPFRGSPLAVSGVVVPEAGASPMVMVRAGDMEPKVYRIPETGIRGAVADVLEFHRRFAPEVLGETPALPTLTANQRVRLENMAHVIGDTKYIRDSDRHYAIGFILEELAETLRAVARGDLAGTTDGLTDLAYVTIRAALTMGIDLSRPWEAVQRANLAKAGGPTCPETGKKLKPPGWGPPDIAGSLASQRPLSETYPPIP
ncbi:hypothetical protein B7486_60695, partial [cyanobacterium TDX16]